MTNPEHDPETDADGALWPPRSAGEAGPVSRSGLVGPAYVVHLRLVAVDDEDALRLADVCAGRLADTVPEVDRWSAQISREDHQSSRRRVYCDTRLPGGRRCDLPVGHRDSPCGVDPGPHWVAERSALDGQTWK